MPRTIGLLIFPDFQLLDAAGPLAAFEVAARHAAPSAYRLQVLARTTGSVTSSSGAAMVAESFADARSLDTLVVSGGIGTRDVAACEATLTFIREASRTARRVASACSGAFVLAAAGLLDDCRATTHWRLASEFARTYPQVRIEPHRIFVRDGKMWTSAGITAGIDLAL